MASDDRRIEVEDVIIARAEKEDHPSYPDALQITRAAIGDLNGDDLFIENLGGGNQRGAGWGERVFEGAPVTTVRRRPKKVWSTFLQGLLDAIDMPAGVVLPYIGDPLELPVGWQAADGTNGTPDLNGFLLLGGTPGNTGTVNAGTGVSYYEVLWIIRVD